MENILYDNGYLGVTTVCSNVIFVLDTTMSKEKVDLLNEHMKMCLLSVKEKGEQNEVDVFVRAIDGGSGEWIIGNKNSGLHIDEVYDKWENLMQSTKNNLSSAVDKCAETLQFVTSNHFRVKRTGIVLVTDGKNYDEDTMKKIVEKIKNTSNKNSCAIIVGVGDYDLNTLSNLADKCYDWEKERYAIFAVESTEYLSIITTCNIVS